MYGGEVVSANYFSTSSGMTANSGEVWMNSATNLFPSMTKPYLSAVKQYGDRSYDFGDLTDCENAEIFFKETDIQSYDSGFPWFRWNVTMTADELAASINQSLLARFETNPNLIKTLQPNGTYTSTSLRSIGDLLDIEVITRGQGGNIMCLRLTGSLATVRVYTELNIRMLLKPARVLQGGRDIDIKRHDGSVITNYSLLPSAFFTMDKVMENDRLAEVTFYGGGNGHGVGMSQNGAKGMIDAGFSAEEILRHYYSGTTVERVF